MLDLVHIRFLVDGCVGRDLVAKALRHFDRENALLKYPLAFDDQIMRPLEPVEVHVPIHPVRRRDDRFASRGFRVTNCLRIFC